MKKILEGFLSLPEMTSKLVADAHLAALAVEHGLAVCSADSDFIGEKDELDIGGSTNLAKARRLTME